MQDLATEVIEVSVHSALLLLNYFTHVVHVGLLVAQQENQLGGVQIVLVDSVARVDGQVAYFRLHHAHPLAHLVHGLVSISQIRHGSR